MFICTVFVLVLSLAHKSLKATADMWILADGNTCSSSGLCLHGKEMNREEFLVRLPDDPLPASSVIKPSAKPQKNYRWSVGTNRGR